MCHPNPLLTLGTNPLQLQGNVEGHWDDMASGYHRKLTEDRTLPDNRRLKSLHKPLLLKVKYLIKERSRLLLRREIKTGQWNILLEDKTTIEIKL
jgi:hypothetical protein